MRSGKRSGKHLSVSFNQYIKKYLNCNIFNNTYSNQGGKMY